MKLMTDELEEKLKDYPLGSQDGLLGKAKVIAQYFNPIGPGVWLITEGNKLENDYELYGYCNTGDDEMAEFGTIFLSDLENIRLPYGFGIERALDMAEDTNIIEEMQKLGIDIPSYLKE